MTTQTGLLGRVALQQELDQTRTRVEKLHVLHNIGTAIASAVDLEEILTRVVEAAVYITHAEEGALLLLSEQTKELHVRAQKGLGERYARGLRIQTEDSIAGEVVNTGQPRRLASNLKTLKVVTGYLVNSIVYVPIALKGRVIGVLSVDNQTVDRAFSEEDEYLLTVLADYAAIALEHARVLEEADRRIETMRETFVRLGEEEEDPQAIWQIVVDQAARLIHAEGSVLFLCHNGRQEVKAVATHQLDPLLGLRLEYGQGMAGRVAESGEPMIQNDFVHWADKAPALAGDEYQDLFRAAAQVPLTWQGRVLGVLGVSTTDPDRAFTEEDIQLLECLAGPVAMAIHHVRATSMYQTLVAGGGGRTLRRRRSRPSRKNPPSPS